jgi:NAD(P)-dependent dehydrogenase (short-subunit alcohol dehydrogenase family)
MNRKLYSLITGSAGLLGSKHAEAILESGKSVIITDINNTKLRKLFNHLSKTYKSKDKIIYYNLDVTSEKSILKLLTNLKKKNILINNLINNAAIDPKFTNDKKSSNKLESFDRKKWEKELAVGLTGSFLCAKHIGYQMVKNKIKGNIVNVASDLSIIAPNQSIYENKFVKPVTYSVIKHGILGLTKYLATYWSRHGIRCNSLSPGAIFNKQSKNFVKKINKQIPMNRMANENEYKEAIKFLCSEKSSYMNGHNLVIDGGRSIW